MVRLQMSVHVRSCTRDLTSHNTEVNASAQSSHGPSAWSALRDRVLGRNSRIGGTTAVVVLFLPPALFLFTLLVALPMGEAAWYSVFRWNGFGSPTEWVGLRNFRDLFETPAFPPRCSTTC